MISKFSRGKQTIFFSKKVVKLIFFDAFTQYTITYNSIKQNIHLHIYVVNQNETEKILIHKILCNYRKFAFFNMYNLFYTMWSVISSCFLILNYYRAMYACICNAYACMLVYNCLYANVFKYLDIK